MAVEKTTSPWARPLAPRGWPRNAVPSSRTRRAVLAGIIPLDEPSQSTHMTSDRRTALIRERKDKQFALAKCLLQESPAVLQVEPRELRKRPFVYRRNDHRIAFGQQRAEPPAAALI